MKVGSLFSGIGGFDEGFRRSGMSCVWAVEIDPAPRSVFSRHFPEVQMFEDVRKVGRHNLATVDVICGGFPCQDLSVAGRREGLSGERSGLWFEFRRIVEELAPRWVVIENVPGLLSSNEGRDFAVVLRGLVKCGYGVSYRVLDAQYFGVAQRRRRVFIVGSLGTGSSAQVLFESEGVSWNPPTRGEAGQGVARSVTASAGHHGHSSPRGDGCDNLVPTLASNGDAHSGFRDDGGLVVDEPYTLDWQAGSSGDTSFRGKARSWICDTPGRTRSLTSNRTLAVIGVDLQNTKLGSDVAGTLDTTRPSRGGGQAVAITEGAHGVTTTDAASSLQSNGGKPGQGYAAALTNFGVRRLTPTECERLQGFPDSWTAFDASGKAVSDSARYRMLGNAVCVPVAEWIGRRVMEVDALNVARERPVLMKVG